MSLDAALAALRAAKRISGTRASYQKDNPGEYAKVISYLDGGPRPSGADSFTEMGKGLVFVEDERRGVVEPPPPPPPTTDVVAPAPPTSYAIPAGAVSVANAAQLIAAMSGSAKDIVLEDGTYDNASPIVNSGGHRLYARNLGKAKFVTGLVMGGSSGSGGALAQGLAFDTPGPSGKLQGGAQIYTWGAAGVGSRIYDCTFEGHMLTEYGIRATQNQGLDCQRLRIRNFRDVGLRASDNVRVAYKAATPRIKRITDIFTENVAYNPPGSSGGVAEAGVWIGHPVDNPVERIDCRNIGRKALETVNSCYDTVFRDLYLDMTGPLAQAGGIGVGCYLEHNNHYNTYEKFLIVGVNRGFNGEWNENTPGNAGAQHLTIRNGIVDANGWTRGGNTAGVYFDTGCDSNTVQGCTFKNQNWAGVGAFQNIGTNVFEPNTYQMQSTALPLRTTHFFH